MKEIFDYLFAGLIILNFIVLYSFIVNTLYTPLPEKVEPVTVSLLRELIPLMLNEQVVYSNISNPLFDLEKYIQGKSVFLRHRYLFGVEITPLLDTRISSNTLNITSPERGKLCYAIVYYNEPGKPVLGCTSQHTPINDKYIYTVSNINASRIAFITVVLDTDKYRLYNHFINYTNTYIVEAYIGDCSGKLCIYIDNLNKPRQSEIEAYLVDYSPSGFNISSKVSLQNVRAVREKGNKISVDVIYVNISYVVKYVDEVGGYARYKLVLFYNETEISVLDSTIYNLVSVYFKSHDKIYIALKYPGKVFIGSVLPINIPTERLEFTSRLGIFDYLIRLYVWR